MKPIRQIALAASFALGVVACNAAPAPHPSQLVAQDSEVLFDTVSGPPTFHVFHFGNMGGTSTGALSMALHGDIQSFTVIADECTGNQLSPNGWCGVQVQLGGDEPGNFIAELEVEDVTKGVDVTVSMSGRITPALLAIAAPATPVTQGQTATATVTVTNGGGGRSGALTVAAAAGATITDDSCTGNTLAGGASCTFGVPYSAGIDFTGASTLHATVSADPGGMPSASIVFNAVAASQLQIDSVDFGSIDPIVGTYKSVKITNPGMLATGPLQVTLGPATGTPAVADAPFVLIGGATDGCSGVALPAGGSCWVNVEVASDLPTPGMYSGSIGASATGVHPGSASLKVSTVLAHGTVSISKSGTGDGQIALGSDPTDMLCISGMSTCRSINVLDGMSTSFVATAASGSLFTSWDVGPCSGSSNPVCTVTGANHANVSIDAVFTKQ